MKIYLGPAVGRSYTHDFISCLLKLLREPNLVFAPQCNDALVSRSRSIALSRFLKRDDCDVFLSIDTDIVFQPKDALALCAAARESQAIVCGLYKVRSDGVGAKPSSIVPRGVTVDSLSDELVPLRYGATGFMAIPFNVAHLVAAKLPLCHQGEEWAFWPAFMPMCGVDDDGNDIYLGEDYAFCERAALEGVPTYALPNVRLGHVGSRMYEFADGPYRLTRLDEPGYRYRLEERELVAAG